MVFDHFARIPALNFRSHPTFDIVSALLSEWVTWVKLSGGHLATGPSDYSSYADLLPLARALIACATTRMLWRSDWPHTTEEEPKPNEPSSFELLGQCAGSNEQLRQILVTNPDELYGFTDSVPTGPSETPSLFNFSPAPTEPILTRLLHFSGTLLPRLARLALLAPPFLIWPQLTQAAWPERRCAWSCPMPQVASPTTLRVRSVIA